MQRKKTNTAKAPKPIIDRKDTLRKKVKQKQEENLKSNLVSSSEEEESEEESPVNVKTSKPTVDRRESLRRKGKQKQEETPTPSESSSEEEEEEEKPVNTRASKAAAGKRESLRGKGKAKQAPSPKSVEESDDEDDEEEEESDDSPSPPAKSRKNQPKGGDRSKALKKREKPAVVPTNPTEEDVANGNDDECYLCEDGGQILCCDNCFRSFHMSCIKLREEPEGEWLCPYCKGLDKHGDKCSNCEESLADAEHYEKLTCSKCLRNIHWKCSDVPLSLIVDGPLNRNFIFEPEIVKELKQSLLKHSMEPKDLIKQLYEKHAFDYLFHVCNSCVKSFGIQKIKNNVKQQFGETAKEDFYLVKLKRSSDIHAVWLKESKVLEVNRLLLRHFRRNFGDGDDGQEANVSDSDEEDPLNQDESYKVERVLSIKRPLVASKKNNNVLYQDIMGLTAKSKPPVNNYKFLIKWEDLEYRYATWEDEFVVLKFKDKVTKYFDNRKKKKKTIKKGDVPPEGPQGKLVRLHTQPEFFEGKLFEYQLAGVNWLVNQYIQRNNAILADEMGLGKTIQTLCLLKYLNVSMGLEGPFLIVAPTSTIFNWQREASKWASNFDVIIYAGDATSRRKIIDHEFIHSNERSGELKPRFHMAITTYTFINQDISRLKKIKWEVIVVDEAQRLKNSESKLYKLCGEIDTNFKLLLTGTPIQNTIDELVSLVKYIIPNKPKLLEEIDGLTSALVNKPIVNIGAKKDGKDAKDAKDGKDDQEREDALKRLKEILKKHMLRRTVQDANLKFPELEEKIVKLNLTNVQKNLYKNIILKNYQVLANSDAILGKQSGRTKRTSENLRISLINILTHLRLVCDHPDLFYSRSFNFDASEGTFEDQVLSGSNKLKFLDKTIPKLLDAGHKILMFTQFVLMLDIVEEFLIFRNYEYDRLDGTTRNVDRQKIIDNFNNGKSKIFILSTRAGGLGINLTSSDTVIFIDSDFNPYRDIQAFCRAYRIGQKNKVMVYRLVSKFTVEEKIVENATKKLMLGEMIINPIDQKSEKGVVESMLRHGANELFDKTFDQENDDEITEEKLTELLSREPKPIENPQKVKVNDLNDFYLSGFNFIDFNFAPIIQTNSVKEPQENKYWETLLSNEHTEFEKVNVEVLGKGKRTKRFLQQPQPTNVPVNDSLSSSSESASEASESKRRLKSEDLSSEDEEEKVTPLTGSLPENMMNYYTQLGTSFEELKEKGLEEIVKICGLEELTRLKFLEFTMKYGISPFRVEDVYKTFCSLIDAISGIVKLPDPMSFRNYLKFFYSTLLYEAESSPISEYFFFQIKPQVIRRRVIAFLNLKNKVNYYKGKVEKFKVRSKKYRKLFKRKGQMEEEKELDETWDNTDDYFLFEGIAKYGMEEWDRIIRDSDLWDHSEIKVYDDKDVWKLIFKRIEERDPPVEKEKECIEFIKEYLRIRSNLLMSMLLEEKEKKSSNEI